MMQWLNQLFHRVFKKEEKTVGYSAPLVTEQEAYIPFRSELLEKYLLSKEVNLKDPIDAGVKLRKFFKSTHDTAIFKGNIDSRENILFKANSNIVVANLKNLKLHECSLILRSEFKDTIVIINVSGKITLNKNAKIELRGELKPENILINYTGVFNPYVMSGSTLLGTVVTLHKLSVLRDCRFEGETIGSNTIVSNGVIVNKTTANLAKLQKEREAKKN